MPEPIVSVCMVTYNHERFIGDAIRSVLAQTFANWELVVVNDGSTDGTANRINEFTDPRISAIHQANQGPAAATNRALAHARGQYVALFSGDDICHPHRLEKQLAEYRRGDRRILFATADFIDDEGNAIEGEHFAKSFFDSEPHNRAQTLRRFFSRGNFLNGVTVFTERAVLGESPYDPALLQIQDFDLWLRLIGQYELQVMPDIVVSYRIRGHNANLSAPVAEKAMCAANEHYLVLRRVFDSIPADLFYDAFSDSILRPDIRDEIHFAIEQAFLLTRAHWPGAALVGIERLHRMLNDPTFAAVLIRDYSFAAPQFFALLGSVDAVNLCGGQLSSLFFDTGGGFTPTQEIRRPSYQASREFALRFQLPPTTGLKVLRWDPVEGRTCRVRPSQIVERYADGQTRVVPLDILGTNGSPSADGFFDFDTHDPGFWWTCDEGVVEVSVAGAWRFDGVTETLQTLRRHNEELRRQLDLRDRRSVNVEGRAGPVRFAKRLLNRLRRAS